MARNGNFNYAGAVGPVGGEASSALSDADTGGAGGTYDLAAVLLTDGTTTAQAG